MKKVLINNEVEKPPVYSKRGFLIEWTKWDRKYFLYLFIRVLVFLFDYIVPFIIQLIMVIVTGRSFLIQLTFISIIYFQSYYFISMVVTKGKTFGMIIGRQRVVHKSGFSTTWINYFVRSITMSIYSIPLIGLGFILINFVSLFLFRGFTLFDLVSGTILITERQYRVLQKIESSWNQN